MAQQTVGYVELTLKYEREGNKWVGTCVELGTSTFARSLRQVQQELEQLVADHLNVLEEEGERERFFQEFGIPFHPSKPTGPDLQLRVKRSEAKPLLFPDLGPFYQPRLFPVSVKKATRRLASTNA